MHNLPIYWINLNRSPERKILMENQFKDYNIENHQRIEGIDGKELNFDEYKHLCVNNLKVFELGCTLSHLKAIETAHNYGNKYALIFEDDCSFEYIKHQKYTIDELIQKMNIEYPGWDILQLCSCGRIDHCERMRDNPCLIERKSRDCTTAYVINQSGMNKIIHCRNIFDAADSYIYKNCNTYCLTKPYFSYQYSNIIKSNVHNQGENSNQTIYAREDNNKRFWDNYYTSMSSVS